MPKVSIIITAHNYAKFLPQAVGSALGQTFRDLEVVVVNDGSTDDTDQILAQFGDEPRLKVIVRDGIGLAAASNAGIRESTGEYIVRLDADDWFDENLALVLAAQLDTNPNIGMVFCDFFTVDVHGEIIEGVKRSKISDEVKLLDRPCLAAGAMYRRRCWEAVGGYNETLRYQEDYDFWIKFIEKFNVHNVSLPLMYYRQHGRSMSRNWNGRMDARRQVKARFVEEHRKSDVGRVLAVIPARADRLNDEKLPLLPLGGRSLLKAAIDKLEDVRLVERVIVSTDDPVIAEAAVEAGAEVPFLRSHSFNNPSVSVETVLGDLLRRLAEQEGYCPDVLVILHPHAPFITAAHITEAIDTLVLYDTDSVVPVVEDLTYHWKPGANGLAPVGYQKRTVRQEKDLIYKESGGLYVTKAQNLTLAGDLLGNRIGHIELAPHEAVRIQSAYNYWIAQRMEEAGLEW